MAAPVVDIHGVRLHERFEIRRLEPKHEPWAIALNLHSNLYSSELWRPLCIGMQAKMCLDAAKAIENKYLPTIEGGWGYGIFDKEYQFKRPESAATDGALYWSEFDLGDVNLEADGRQKLLDAMDFPLVSIGMSNDASNSYPAEVYYGALSKALPYTNLFMKLQPKNDGSAQQAIKAPEKQENPKPGQVLGRTGSATKIGYEGKGLMTSLSHFIMYEAKAKGYKSINVDMSSRAIFTLWSKPPAPFTATVTKNMNPAECDSIVNGERVMVFEKCVDSIHATITVHL